jgi:hypothetical protein
MVMYAVAVNRNQVEFSRGEPLFSHCDPGSINTCPALTLHEYSDNKNGT